jgi:glycosyltransferase involved in cell wall biosynthesis
VVRLPTKRALGQAAEEYRAAVRVVVNAVPVRGTSLGVVTENLLVGWDQLGLDDEVHVVLRPGVSLDLPPSVTVHEEGGRRFAVMERRVPALCRHVKADAMLGVTPATTMAPLPCPRGVLALDIRHELRPEQFSRQTRLQRGVSYRIGYRQADAIMCISERTRDDLLEAHPYLRRRRVVAAQLGADHVLSWAPRVSGPPYALAFGQWGNKNVGLVIDAWALLRRQGDDVLPLVLVGLPADAREATVAHVAAHDLDDIVTVQPWLSTTEFQRTFTSASLVVFPSDFEGFGLPALEALRLGIPVVVTPDKALLEVTGGKATVMDGWHAAALAAAVPLARATSDEDRRAGIEQASAFTWRRTASVVRSTLAACRD